MQNQKNGESDRDRRRLAKSLGLLSTITSELVGLTGAGLGIGWFAWKKWGAPQILIPVLAVAGFTIAMVQIFKISQQTEESDETDKRDGSE